MKRIQFTIPVFHNTIIAETTLLYWFIFHKQITGWAMVET